MTRVLELLVSLLIVAALIVIVGVLLPSHGHVERSVVVSNPVRQIYDSVNTLRRFPEWSPQRRLDPKLFMEYEGVRSGPGATVKWRGNETVGNGSLSIVSSEPDSQVKMALEDDSAGTNKTYTITLEPSENKKTTRIVWAYDVDYGWDLAARYAGLYIHGKPDATVQTAVANISSMLAAFPNVDYKDQEIKEEDVAAVPMLFVSTKAPRSLDEVEMATTDAVTKIQAFMAKVGLNQAGPVRTITSNWGDQNYAFDVAIPVDKASVTIDGAFYEITQPQVSDVAEGFVGDKSMDELKAGERDDNGHLYLADGIRATLSYAGKALVTEYSGSAAALPLLRLQEKAFAETHGYLYSEMNGGRFWDEVVSTDEEGMNTFKVYLPIEL